MSYINLRDDKIKARLDCNIFPCGGKEILFKKLLRLHVKLQVIQALINTPLFKKGFICA